MKILSALSLLPGAYLLGWVLDILLGHCRKAIIWLHTANARMDTDPHFVPWRRSSK